MKKDNPKIHVSIEGAEGRIEAGLEVCAECMKILSGDVMVMLRGCEMVESRFLSSCFAQRSVTSSSLRR